MNRRNILGAAALLLFGLAVAAFIAEGTLRVFARTSPSTLAWRLRADPYAVLIEPHGVAGYRPRPGRVFAYENGTRSNINALGYRGPEVALPKPAGTTRIVIIGGSTTHGWGVDDSATIDRYMREQLAREFPGRRFEVVNLGVDGYDSHQILERLRTDGLRLDPDVVIVNTGVNDVRNARFPGLRQDGPDERTLLWAAETERLRDEQARGGPAPFTRMKHWLFTARLPGALMADAGSAPDTLRTPFPDAMDYFQRNLVRIAELLHTDSTVLLLSSEPSSLRTKYRPDDTSHRTYWIGDAATTQNYRDSLDARLQHVVDSTAALGWPVARVPYAELSPELFLDDAHLTADGNRRLADAFVASLRPWLDRPGG